MCDRQRRDEREDGTPQSPQGRGPGSLSSMQGPRCGHRVTYFLDPTVNSKDWLGLCRRGGVGGGGGLAVVCTRGQDGLPGTGWAGLPSYTLLQAQRRLSLRPHGQQRPALQGHGAVGRAERPLCELAGEPGRGPGPWGTPPCLVGTEEGPQCCPASRTTSRSILVPTPFHALDKGRRGLGWGQPLGRRPGDRGSLSGLSSPSGHRHTHTHTHPDPEGAGPDVQAFPWDPPREDPTLSLPLAGRTGQASSGAHPRP